MKFISDKSKEKYREWYQFFKKILFYVNMFFNDYT